ncbi:hypothetical protein PPL_04542 [Heterostelium album PN500]|uniref:Uncharacterized protein n=1 Tax=Heterostelium pallidum (strain ATCC 26659 / Pp 5 / PN500) TaxID=670386 RepID=D3B7V4_HETP5|nr:hypothetical protein PPL_04542 [Heterostelium album PN500]EFA82847.1 hypothetical protein PPL_04542 [Heterostelium album PN500]|eukprot:XP_020434964.1 hypothetical protein PPL_04542 [Heterostelium album PN500]
MPLFGLHIYWMVNGQHKVFATEIYRVLPQYKRRFSLKTAFYIVSFFIYLYCLILHLVAAFGEPGQKRIDRSFFV